MTLDLSSNLSPDDQQFLKELFFEQMEERLPGVPSEQFNLLADMQYQARQNGYAQTWPEAVTYVIREDRYNIGLLMLDHLGQTLHVVDVLLSRASRGQGKGRMLMQQVIRMADEEKLDVTLSVATGNPAIHLYQRLGFEVISQNEAQVEMRRSLSVVQS